MEKQILSFLVLFFCAAISLTQTEETREFEYTEGDTTYVMRRYIFCLYLSGPERGQSDDETKTLQAAHLAHLGAMEEKGLVMAGPFGDETEKRGVLLFDLPTLEDAGILIDHDPMVIAGRLAYECHPLWLAKGTRLP
jgi:uncharacterized protein YciI